jgi:hypothetical protein
MAVIGTYGEPCVSHHTALIFDRGGSQRLWQLLDMTSVQWQRKESNKSQATLSITGTACSAQAVTLDKIEPRRHELVLFRGKERVWEGPIVQATTTSSVFTLTANDIIEYLDGTALSASWQLDEDGGSTGMVERLEDIITYELTTPYIMETNQGPVIVTRWENQEPPANILPFMDFRPGPTRTTAVSTPFQMTLGQYLANRGDSIGVSYTTVGRKLVIWDGVLGQVRTVTENDFSGDFQVIKDGSSLYTIEHVASTSAVPGVDPLVGHAANDTSYYGPWEQIASTTDTGSTTESPDSGDSGDSGAELLDLNTQARAGLTSAGYPVPLVLKTADGSSLIPSAGLGINDLVAGIQVPVRAANNIRRVSEMQRLNQMTVTETADQGEVIQVTMEAVGDVVAA